MKLKLIALACMLAAGSANAAIDRGDLSGNGELLMNLKWKDTNTTLNGNTSASAAFDLGITLDYAAANFNTAGFSQSWDLGSYGSALSTFLGTTDLVMANAEMSVFAIDGTGSDAGAAGVRLISTTSGISTTGSAVVLANTSIPTNGTLMQIPGNGIVGNYFAAVNNSGSHVGGDIAVNGASNADPSSGAALFTDTMDKFGQTQSFDSTGKFDGSYAAGTGVLAGQAKALPFYMVTTSSNDPVGKATMTPFGFDVDGDGVVEFDNNGATAGGVSEYGLWTLQGSTLTYSVAAVPEAETYAMMLAGLGLVGFMVRRRRNAI